MEEKTFRVPQRAFFFRGYHLYTDYPQTFIREGKDIIIVLDNLTKDSVRKLRNNLWPDFKIFELLRDNSYLCHIVSQNCKTEAFLNSICLCIKICQDGIDARVHDTPPELFNSNEKLKEVSKCPHNHLRL